VSAEELPFGQRLRQRREQAGMTRPVLAGLVGRSAEWVKAVETGRLRQPRLPILLRLAEVLGVVDLVDLTGEQSLEVASFTRGRHPNVTAIRAAVQRCTVERPDRPPYAVSLDVDLWKSREGLRRAGRIDPATIPSRERRGRFFVEMARGHHAAGEPVAAARYLLRACDEGTDAVRWSPAAQTIVDSLVAKPPAAARDDVRRSLAGSA